MSDISIPGHDTTANSLALAIALLSARPQIQDWLAEEINAVIGEAEEPNYETHFPKLVRCQATLVRKYTPHNYQHRTKKESPVRNLTTISSRPRNPQTHRRQFPNPHSQWRRTHPPTQPQSSHQRGRHPPSPKILGPRRR